MIKFSSKISASYIILFSRVKLDVFKFSIICSKISFELSFIKMFTFFYALNNPEFFVKQNTKQTSQVELVEDGSENSSSHLTSWYFDRVVLNTAFMTSLSSSSLGGDVRD